MRHHSRLAMSFGIGGFAAKRRQHLCANALDRLVVEARHGQRQPQQIEALILALAQDLERTAHLIALRVEVKLDGIALQPLLEGARIELAGAFVERGRRHIGDTGLGAGS